MKKTTIFILFIIILLFLSGCSNQKDNNENNSNTNTESSSNEDYSVNKLSTENTPPKETDISSFSTNLVHRYTNSKKNISVGCSILNGTVINSGDTFSFWNVLGDTTKEKGYVAADSFDEDGDTVQTYGGGVCQISTTLYNAVLAVPNVLSVIERHPHSKPVEYVEKGKDATVSYPSVDFKFKNNSNTPIKIYAEYQDTAITIRIVKIE